ncbi:MAG: tRNA (adenosine(37)-N6)-threonylcarbamoyltransferase complex ATPase subunit type 1 TsaE [Thermoleophilia bacterium]|nr:tRNA (adenosine(37)-N6)-threonylcarbamoyltransferase complex ATPase subunit type 1 TsaE [Thermoleophilia bacterium]
MREIVSSSPGETERIAAELAGDLEVGDVVTVAGELGAGKTTFVRGACRALGVRGPITSPTYALAHRYEGRVAVSHLDLYRLDALAESDWADLEPYFDGAVAFVEWPERAARVLPRARRRVRLRLLGPDRRLIEVEEEGKALQNHPFPGC